MRSAPLLLLPLVAGGCGLNLRVVDSSVKKPSNVAMYMMIKDGHKEPVPNLAAEHFKVYEDGKLVSTFESKQTILNPEVSAVHDTLLLMDMSGSVVGSGAVNDLVEAAGAFTDQVGKVQQVGVYAFDGSKDIYPIAGFSPGSGARAGIAALHSFKPRDPSTNLNGAILEGLHVLDKQLASASQPLKFGTLVVFTDGSDRAHRVANEQVQKALDELGPNMSVFVIGVGAEIDEKELRAIGRDGIVLSKNPAEVKTAFAKVASRVEGFTKSFYLFSYCSPSRAGKHEVKLVADAANRGTGSIKYEFDATGFGPNCDPNTRPAFDVRRPRLAVPTPTPKK